MLGDLEISLLIDFDELFGLKDRLRPMADEIRRRLLAAGLREQLEAEVFDNEMELRTTGKQAMTVRLDSFHLEINGARPTIALHNLAALLLDEAGAFRLTSVEVGYSATLRSGAKRPLDLVAKGFANPMGEGDEGPLLDRRFAMTWDWGNATTGYSYMIQSTEDQELFLSLKAREGYMTLPELQKGHWLAAQNDRFKALTDRFLAQIGWQ